MTWENEAVGAHAGVLLRIVSSARRQRGEEVTFREDEREMMASARELARLGFLELHRAGAGRWAVTLTERARELDRPQLAS